MAARRTYTPEFIENGRYRYEESDEPVASIAADFGVHVSTFYTYMKKWGFRLRCERAPLDLSPAQRALAAARKAPRSTSRAKPDARAARSDGAVPDSALESADTAGLIARLHAAVEQELAAVERLRAQLGPAPENPGDAERTARTLATLARTLGEVERLRGAVAPPAHPDDDDMPTDIDEFRRELARRIDAFVASRADEAVRGDGESAVG
ncbi:MAG: hypothetical protein IRZ09_12460 [Variibacter sp.]|nr:hypothetical protein [Variibacter sp.]